MKLLCCCACRDVVALRLEWRTCACGLTSGRYVDNLNAVIYGEQGHFAALGIANNSLAGALQTQREVGDLPPVAHFGGHPPGRTFEAFILPTDCPSVTYHLSAPPAENDIPDTGEP